MVFRQRGRARDDTCVRSVSVFFGHFVTQLLGNLKALYTPPYEFQVSKNFNSRMARCVLLRTISPDIATYILTHITIVFASYSFVSSKPLINRLLARTWARKSQIKPLSTYSLVSRAKTASRAASLPHRVSAGDPHVIIRLHTARAQPCGSGPAVPLETPLYRAVVVPNTGAREDDPA
jgi:hypothetical protein